MPIIENIDAFILDESATIRDALDILNLQKSQVVLVTKDDRILIGILTYGDVRRFLGDNTSMDTPVNKVMNAAPITATIGSDVSKLHGICDQYGVLAIPLIRHNKVQHVYISGINENAVKKENIVVIMAGGFGSRLRPLTDNCPKPMLPIGDKPLLERIILNFRRQGFYKFIISTYYKSEMITKYFGDGAILDVEISYLMENSPLGTGGALSIIDDNLLNDAPIIITNGDIFTTLQYDTALDFFTHANADAMVCSRMHHQYVDYGVVTVEGRNVQKIEEKPTFTYNINAGIYFLQPWMLRKMPKNQRTDMPDFINHHLSNDISVVNYVICEYWMDMGRHEDYRRLQDDIQLIDPN